MRVISSLSRTGHSPNDESSLLNSSFVYFLNVILRVPLSALWRDILLQPLLLLKHLLSLLIICTVNTWICRHAGINECAGIWAEIAVLCRHAGIYDAVFILGSTPHLDLSRHAGLIECCKTQLVVLTNDWRPLAWQHRNCRMVSNPQYNPHLQAAYVK